ncbi:MAG TPA: hypothetical protein VNI61_11430 [Gemmatimonadales bacterium]|nr:hypothetical protein [Gemmatimonadales bacterium]
MFRSCAFCNASFDGDGAPAGLGVGRRFAFDEWKGRLWVICHRCARWNLTPLEDRLERIEALARLVPTGRLLAASEQVALIRWGGYDLVRVGRPPRVELAAWRYGERLRARARDRAKVVVPLTVVALGLGIAANVAAGGSLGILVWNLHSLADAAYIGLVGRRRVRLADPPVCARCGTVMELRARDLQHARLVPDPHAELATLLSCPSCQAEGALLTGADAAAALRQGLTYLNATRAGRRRAEEAALVVDRIGGAGELLRDVARRELTLRSLHPDRRLALEMAVDEQEEIRELERRWREAEEIAGIADGLLSSTPELEDHLRRLREKGKSQPNS